MRRKQWDEAANAYETLLEFEPAAPGELVYLGDAYRRAGRAAEALGAYGLAANGEPENMNLLNSLASTYAELGQVDSAIVMCRRILALDPGNERALRNMKVLGTASEK